MLYKLLTSLSALIEAAPPKSCRPSVGVQGDDSLGGGLFERLPMPAGRKKSLLAQVRATLWLSRAECASFFSCASSVQILSIRRMPACHSCMHACLRSSFAVSWPGVYMSPRPRERCRRPSLSAVATRWLLVCARNNIAHVPTHASCACTCMLRPCHLDKCMCVMSSMMYAYRFVCV